ncbi:ead/Ea22-like family protein [Enterobacter hormaechei]|uniref:ead/Ea22-like family protein n=1 Tax=Enterobacter cloacae complex TaxID=354276 RepID=UPI0010BF404E|nr:ead/Ea22-like family protein [Enterobacter hormaechei]MCM8175778.1 ead/Ea22-like family protein [Enterobacter hormaechei]QWS89637.1 ead/Ea22-like family protein [Enterobacter hormaechei]
MSNIDKRALREAAEKASTDNHTQDEWFHYLRCSTPETVLALLDELEKMQAQSSKWCEAFHKAVSVGARYEERIAELESDNAYIKNRHKELDLLIGKNILVMQAAIVEWQGTGDARKGLAWIYNTLFGPGELPDEAEKDAQAYFDRKYGPLDEELMTLHRWFWEQSEAERAAAAGKGE